jgi:hypothetical protein
MGARISMSACRHAVAVLTAAMLGGTAGSLVMRPPAGWARAPRLLETSWFPRRFRITHRFQVRPGHLQFYSPVAHFPTEYIGGRRATHAPFGPDHRRPIEWTRWGRDGAVGRGDQWEDDCQPNCPDGRFVHTPATVRAARVRHGRYTRLTLRLAPRGLPPTSLHYRLKRTDGLFYWGNRSGVADRAPGMGVVRAGAVRTSAVAARLPGLLWHDGGRTGAFLVRPRSVYDTEDTSGVIGVLHRHGDELERGPGRGFLHWRHWTAHAAFGVGTQWVKLGSPAATSPFTREPLTVSLSRVRSHRFTRMTLRSRLYGRRATVRLCLSAPYNGSCTWDELYDGRCT